MIIYKRYFEKTRCMYSKIKGEKNVWQIYDNLGKKLAI